MAWLKKHTSEPLTVAMSGIKLGDRVLIVGCSDAALIAALAIKAGLTGRACTVDSVASRVAETAQAVERERRAGRERRLAAATHCLTRKAHSMWSC